MAGATLNAERLLRERCIVMIPKKRFIIQTIEYKPTDPYRRVDIDVSCIAATALAKIAVACQATKVQKMKMNFSKDQA